MNDLSEVRAIVRLELLDRVVHQLKRAGVPRMTIHRVHAVGAGVDPATARFTLDEGTELTIKAQVDFICPSSRVEELIEAVTDAAHTGRRGDGIVSVHPVLDVRKIRTGLGGTGALE